MLLVAVILILAVLYACGVITPKCAFTMAFLLVSVSQIHHNASVTGCTAPSLWY